MTISTTTSSVTYSGNGSTTVWSFSFVPDSESDLTVSLTETSTGYITVLDPIQYAVVINAIPVGGLWGIGGTVTYPSPSGTALPAGWTITIDREVPLTQSVSISNQGAFYPQAVEQALDILELQIQQVDTAVDTVTTNIGDITADVAACQAAAAASQFALQQILNLTIPYNYVNNFFNVVADATIISQIQAGTYAGHLDSYWATAMSLGKAWYFPAGTYPFLSALTMIPGLEVYGIETGTIFNSSSSGYAFVLQNPNGTQEIQGPKFSRITLNIPSGGGIQLNSIAGGFTDDSSTQQYMMRPIIEDCIITGGGTGIGIQWSKTFDGHILRSKITSFATGINFEGTDISSIEQNRITECSSQSLLIHSHGTFGSQANIRENDLLGSNGTNANGVIVSNDLAGIIENNFIETDAVMTSIIILTGGLSARVNNNRLQCANATYWLYVFNNSYDQIEAFSNGQSAMPKPVFFYPGGAEYYVYNTASIRQILHGGNTSDTGFPWYSQPQNVLPANTAFCWYPGAPDGLTVSNYAATVNGLQAKALGTGSSAWILPPLTSFGSLISFADNSYTLIGTFDIEVVAYSNVVGQVLNYQILDGGTPIAGSTVTLTANPKKFVIASGFAATTGLSVKLWNADTGHNGNAFILSLTGTW